MAHYLPAGWEVRLDQSSGRHFYVDHNTRTTHWDPPVPAASHHHHHRHHPQQHEPTQHPSQRPPQPQQPPLVPEPTQNATSAASASTSAAPSPADEVAQALSKVDAIGQKATAAHQRLQALASTAPAAATDASAAAAFAETNRRAILEIEENLTVALLSLDAIESGGHDQVRSARKSAVLSVNAMVTDVDNLKQRLAFS